MCYLENFWPLATFGVQSNTFSLTYANILMKNCLGIAQMMVFCARFCPLLRVIDTFIMQIKYKNLFFSWSIEKLSVALQNQSNNYFLYVIYRTSE